MKNLKKSIILSTILLSPISCASTYRAPETKAIIAKSNHSQNYSKLLKKAKRILAMRGYQITYFDKSEGLIFTAHTDYKLTPAQANCGKTMGLDYLKDKRTKTEISFNIIVSKDKLIVKGNFKGEYKPGGWTGTQNINLTCISKGVLEKELLKQIIGG